MSREQALSEYFNFLRNLPDIIPGEKEKLIELVKHEWNIDDLLLNIHKLKFEKKLVNIGNGDSLLDKLSIKIGRSLRVLCPPVSRCLLCNENLTMNNKASQIIVHTLEGPKMYSKYILRCRNCRLSSKEKFAAGDENIRQDVYYHPDKVQEFFKKFYDPRVFFKSCPGHLISHVH